MVLGLKKALCDFVFRVGCLFGLVVCFLSVLAAQGNEIVEL